MNRTLAMFAAVLFTALTVSSVGFAESGRPDPLHARTGTVEPARSS